MYVCVRTLSLTHTSAFMCVFNSKNKKLVDLEPAYYVKINKQWKTLYEWLNTNNQLDSAGKEGLVDGL